MRVRIPSLAGVKTPGYFRASFGREAGRGVCDIPERGWKPFLKFYRLIMGGNCTV